MEQFGVYLSPLDTVKYKESVCPAYFNDFSITPHHYQTMASTLYQKLQSPDVVPLEHTAVCNIIKRYAEKNECWRWYIQPCIRMLSSYLPNQQSVMKTSIYMLNSLIAGSNMRHMPIDLIVPGRQSIYSSESLVHILL